ncbi:7242_t:CDS:1 [Paraglomus occultum]|uniref:7242_t:CDS:1 n=1 Tax=Paraglomus occultum TaxID=144539 RepID=A0A9N9G9D4_9GLOM|nr:7242_t:CDS:1 [Paraglomus occultum]
MSTFVPIRLADTCQNLPPTDTPITSIFKYADILTPSEINLVNHPPYNLTLSLDALLDPTYNQRKKHVTRQLLPRPQNSWIIFRRDFEGRLRAQHPTEPYTIHEISKIAGNQWKIQSDMVKEYFYVLSKLAQKLHQLAFPGYVYKPKRATQRKRNGNFLFKNIDKATFTSKQHSRMHSQRNIEDTNIQSIKGQTKENNQSTVFTDIDRHFVYENTHNDAWLEDSFEDGNNYVTSLVCHDIQLTNPDNSTNICNTDSTSMYSTFDLPIQYLVYNPFVFISDCPQNDTILEMYYLIPLSQIDTFNVDTRLIENSGQTWPAQFYITNYYG